jgi:ribonuclease E
MSVILRTAGMSRTKVEIKRDLDYLMRLWDEIRDLTLKSTAPTMVYEEGNLVKRAIRDIYDRDIEEVIIEGEDAFKDAKRIMKLLMPSHVKKVVQYEDEKIPLLHKYQVENQINQIGDPVVTLKSGGYLVLHPTEALVSVDVNSGRATKERHIEETALKTNLEAAEEVARQLKLRDLGGLIVIDFIDMEDYRNNVKVEQRLKQALSGDRARIQVGRISNFGLLELSRQRLNPSLVEAQFHQCEHCAGMGVVRATDSAAIMAVRALEEEGIKGKGVTQVTLKVPADIALYILNHKRHLLASVEARYGFNVVIVVDETLRPTRYQIESFRQAVEPSDDDEGEEGQSSNNNQRRDNRERNDRDNRGERGERGERQERGDRDKSGERGERQDRPERAERSDEEGGREGGRRRRGRRGRGGRGRDRGEGNTENQIDQTDTDQDDVIDTHDVAGEAANDDVAEAGNDAEADAPKKGRGRGGNGRGRGGERRESADTAEAPSVEAPVEAEATEAPAKRGRGGKSKAAEAKADAKTESKADAVKAEAKPAKAEPQARQFFSRREEASAPEVVAAPKTHEVINESEGPKKKGWWSKAGK